MSISENSSTKGKPISIRYIVSSSSRNNSTANSNSSPTTNKSFVSARYNSTTIGGTNDGDFDDDAHFLTLLEDSRDDDAFVVDSANEADENDNSNSNQDASMCHQNEGQPIYEDEVIKDEEEEIAMECRVIKPKEAKAAGIVLDAPKPTSDTAAFSVNCCQEKFHLTFKSMFFRLSQLFQRHHSLPFIRIRLIFAAFLFAASFILPSFLTGLATGIYISLVIFLFLCVSDPIPPPTDVQSNENVNKIVSKKLAEKSEDEQHEEKIFKGWMNILNEHYRPHTFHVNTIQTVLVRLDGNLLRISRPERVMLKHCFHIDPTLSEAEPRMTAQNIYDLTGAKVKLRPRRLARRRWFSRKYPICIKLAKIIEGDRSEINSNGNEIKKGKTKKKMEKQQNGSEENGSKDSSPSLGSRNNEMEWINEVGADDEDSATDLSEDDLPIRHSISDFSLAARIQQRISNKKYPSGSGRYIFLFARSTREKERWFHKLRMACTKYKPDNSIPAEPNDEHPKRRVSFESLENLTVKMSRDFLLYSLQEFQFTKQLEHLLDQMPVTPFTPETTSGTVAMDLGLNKWQKPTDTEEIPPQFVVLVNLVATRLFYDFCRDKYWCEAVRNKIQTKLATIHLPYFIETLELSTFDLGTNMPKIMKVYKPTVDEWGIWCDFEIKYNGLIKLGLETRVNLMKLKSVSESTEAEKEGPKDDCTGQTAFSTSILRATPSRYSDEEMPESPETSPDEEFGAKLKEFTSKRQKTGQKIFSLVDRFAHSKYFREATGLKPIRKMMEEISSTRLMLNVEVTSLEGIMTANFPPPPSDRLWYGFRVPPQMSMRAIPQVGDRSVVYSALSDWIENKLQLILEKNLVLPNMDDVVIPLMSGNQLLQGNLNR